MQALILTLICCVLVFTADAQNSSVNYDESKVAAYTPRNPLINSKGVTIQTATDWVKQQRPYFLRLFAENVYGRFPSAPRGIHFKVTETDSNALNGKAISKQVTIYFTSASNSPSMELLLYVPKNTQGPVPVFTGLNFYGNQAINKDPRIHLPKGWLRSNTEMHILNNRATEQSRGVDGKWPVEEIIKRGYGLATVYYGDLEPDNPDGWKTGIRSTLKSELNSHLQSRWIYG